MAAVAGWFCGSKETKWFANCDVPYTQGCRCWGWSFELSHVTALSWDWGHRHGRGKGPAPLPEGHCSSCVNCGLSAPDLALIVIFQWDSFWMPFCGRFPSRALAVAAPSSSSEPAFPYWKKMKCTFQNVSFSCRTLSPLVEWWRKILDEVRG